MGKEGSVMKKNNVKVVVISIVVVIVFAAAMYYSNVYRLKSAQYTNIFEYLISLEDEEFAFSPKGLQYGLSREEVIQLEQLKEYDVDEYGNLSFTKDITDVLGHDAEFHKQYVFSSEEKGLVEVECFISGNAQHAEELLRILYTQAKEYMPSPQEGTFAFIKAGQVVTWCDYVENDELAKTQKSQAQIRPSVPLDGKGNYVVAFKVEQVFGR